MNETPLQENISCYSLLYSDDKTREETIETVVPDTMPDIARLLDTDTVLTLRSKTVRSGAVTAEVQLTGTVLYIGEDGSLRQLELTMPTAFSFEREDITEADCAVVRIGVNTAEARMLNPRKILLRAETAAALWVYRSFEVQLSSEPEGTEGLQTLTQEETVSYIGAIVEKTFTVAEELALPGARPAAERILRSRTELCLADTKQVGSKIILQGEVRLEVLYLPVGDAIPVQERFSLSFSQLIDSPAEGSGSFSVSLLPYACSVEPLPGSYGDGVLHLELQITAQCVCRYEKEIRYVADAYSVRGECTLRTAEYELCGAAHVLTMRDTVREQLEVPDDAGTCFCSYAALGMPAKDGNTVSVPVTLHALYTTEKGQITSAVQYIRAELLQELPGETAGLAFTADCTEPYVSLLSGSIDFRQPIELKAEYSERKLLKIVQSAELTPETGTERIPSLTLVRMEDGSIWSLAKKYRSTTELIENANPGPLQSGMLILIPHAR